MQNFREPEMSIELNEVKDNDGAGVLLVPYLPPFIFAAPQTESVHLYKSQMVLIVLRIDLK